MLGPSREDQAGNLSAQLTCGAYGEALIRCFHCCLGGC